VSKNKQEPSALNRAAAREMRDIFVALVDEGFTEDQALKILANMVKTSAEMQIEDD
jgi:hypothetical protein